MVTNEQAKKLAREVNQIFRGDVRKLDAYERWLVYEEAYPQLVANRISKTHNDPDTIARMCEWVDVSCNLALDILPQICVCWKNGAKREVRGASDRQNGKMRELYEQLCVDALAPEWNAQGCYYTELLVMPQVGEDGEIRLSTVLPHMYEAIPSDHDPLKDAGYIYTTNPRTDYKTEHDHEPLDPRRVETDYVIVDDVGWRTYDGRTGEEIVAKRQEHGLGYVPAIRLSFHRSFGGSRWSHSKRMQRLHDATLAASLVNTTMNFVRKAQNRQLFLAIGDFDESNDGQVADPEEGVGIQANPNAVSVSTLNFDTPPQNFITQIQWIYQAAAQSYGGYAVLEPQNTGGNPRVEFGYDAQAEVRDRQLPHARKFERDLAATIVDVMRAAGHKDAAELPDSDKIREGHSVDFGNLSRRFANPQEQKDYFEFLKNNGAMTQIDLVRSIEGATLSDERVWEIIENNIEIQSKFNDLIASRDLLMSGEGAIVTASQANGAMGPAAKAGQPQQQPADAGERPNNAAG